MRVQVICHEDIIVSFGLFSLTLGLVVLSWCEDDNIGILERNATPYA